MPYLLTRTREQTTWARLRIPDQPAILGRSRRASMRIQDPSISKLHASITPVPGTERFRLDDLGSRNGIRHRGIRRKTLEVGVGDEFVLGNVTVTVCGEGPDTLPIPEGVPRPIPGESADEGKSSPALWNRAERNLLVGFVLIAALLGGLALWWPHRSASLPRPEGEATKSAADADAPPAVVESATVERARAAANPTAARPPAPTTPLTRGDRAASLSSAAEVEPWHGLGAALDRSCDGGGCHLATAQLSFVPGGTREVGRWERNILAIRSRASFERRDDGWWLAPIHGVSAHSSAMALGLDDSASRGVSVALSTRGRLMAARSVASPLPEWLDSVSIDRLVSLRRAAELLFGRRATLDELYRWQSRGLDDIVREARERPEFWRERARRAAAERAPGASHATVFLPLELQPDEVPTSASEWGSAIRRWLARLGTAVGESAEFAPIPRTDDDSAFPRWLAARLSSAQDRVRYDVTLRSIAVGLLGRPLEAEEELGVGEHAMAELTPQFGARLLARTLVYSPALAVPPPIPGQEVAWVRRFARWLGERELPIDVAESMARRLFDGSADPRVFVEEMSLVQIATAFSEPLMAVPKVEPGISPTLPNETQSSAVQPRELRIEVWCAFPVRDLLKDSTRVPRLWARLDAATLSTFPTDPSLSMQQAQASALPSDATLRYVISHCDPLRRSVGESVPMARPATWLADGLLTPGLRRLTDRLGEPRIPAIAPGLDDWVRTSLGLVSAAATAGEPASSAPASSDDTLWETSAYLLRAGGSQGSVYRPAARTLLIAMGELAREAAGDVAVRNSVVWVPMPKPPGDPDRHWDDFSTTLDLLSVRYPDVAVDLWLWGSARDGVGTETLRMRWGARHGRGWVQHESEVARRFHPVARRVAIEDPAEATPAPVESSTELQEKRP